MIWHNATRKKVGYVLAILRRLSYKSRVSVKDMLYIFDALARSCILYASEALGCFLTGKLKGWDKTQIEKLHFQGCKAILGLKKQTDNNGVRSELGRLPLLYNVERNIIKYAYSVSGREGSIVGQLWSDASFISIGLGNRVSTIKGLKQAVQTNIKLSVFLKQYDKEFKTIYRNHWEAAKDKSRKLKYTYYRHKLLFAEDKYLRIKDSRKRVVLTKFRLSQHELRCETLRRSRPRVPYEDRLCIVCDKAEVENEEHVLFSCSFYANLRGDFYEHCVRACPHWTDMTPEIKYVYIMSQDSVPLSVKLADYIDACMSKRRIWFNTQGVA